MELDVNYPKRLMVWAVVKSNGAGWTGVIKDGEARVRIVTWDPD